ncbi:hypothetical protein [Spiroplasma floricola]|uniref:Uncharacterized protein n=1 Tax=Spiroplasma floricola 23-6 TaxID=1336749 RepID=A0A2K8SEM3_9MOLU|nr:hypothetical protein [Spiroplasma floricola]AUB31708.1 hypothetical protein SFLOR_v1c06580 [Spiroplasma floricola 23-6]
MYYVFSNGRVFYVVDRFMNVIYKFMTLVEAQQVASFLNYQGSINTHFPMRMNGGLPINNINNLLPYDGFSGKVKNFNLPIPNKNMYLKPDESTYDEYIKNNPLINQMDEINELNNRRNKKLDKNNNEEFWKAKLQELEKSLNEKNKQKEDENSLRIQEALKAKIRKLEDALKTQELLSDEAAEEEKKTLKAKIKRLEEALEEQEAYKAKIKKLEETLRNQENIRDELSSEEKRMLKQKIRELEATSEEQEALKAKIKKLEDALKNQENESMELSSEEKRMLKQKIRRLEQDLEEQKTIDFENNQEVEKLRTEIKELRAKKAEIIYRDAEEDPNAFLTTREINNFIQEIEK